MQLTGRPPVLGKVVAHGCFGSGTGRLTPAAVWYSLHVRRAARRRARCAADVCGHGGLWV